MLKYLKKERKEELKDVKFEKSIIRPNGKVMDLFRINDDKFRLAIVVCVHGRIWEEGDGYEESGGSACKKCIEYKITKIYEKNK